MKWWAIYTNLPMDVIVRIPHPQSGHSQGQKTFLATSAVQHTRNYDIECSNYCPSLSTLTPNGLSRSKRKWRAIHKNIPVDVIVRLPHSWSADSQGQETFLSPSADKQTRNYDIECSNDHPSLSTLRPKGLSLSKMKWWAIHTKLPVDVIFRLPYPQSGNSQNQETFLAPSASKQTGNYDIDCSNCHPSLSTLRSKGLSRSKMKWWAIYTNLPMDIIVRLPHPWSRNSQSQETFSGPSADKHTCNYDIDCSNHHPTLWSRRKKRLSRSKMKWWTKHRNVPVDFIVRLPDPWSGDSHDKETFLAPSADNPTINYDI